MSGRAYTMKEMRTIVEYLNSRKAYGEVRGRKLWTDFASSNLTNRTWQSLKETFLKRILPDIHNPYFGLTKSEICSFKQGYDVDARHNKLDIHTISDDSNHSNAGNVQDNEKPSTSCNNEADISSGEKNSPSTLNARTRASTETIILDNCYENAEDIQRDLESPKNNKDTGSQDEKDTQNKCLRDLITYAEPLTPMMQQVLDDFATEDELVEAELEILEGTNNKKNEENSNKTNLEIDKDKGQIENKDNGNSIEEEIVNCSDSIKLPLGQETKVSESNSVKKSSDLIENNNVKDNTKKGDEISFSLDKIAKNKDYVDLTNDTATQNTNNTTDTIIPGNQEAFKNKNENIELTIAADTTKKDLKKLTLSRKRSFSLNGESNIEKKKKSILKNKDVTQSETDDKSEKKRIENIREKNKGDDENNKQSTNNLKSTEENKAVVSHEENFSQVNPCLNSVSLYEEQFNNTKYTDSDTSDNLVINANVEVHEEEKDEDKHEEKNEDTNKEKVEENKNKEVDIEDKNENVPKVVKNTASINEVVILKSHSDSDDSNNDGDNQVIIKQGKVKQGNGDNQGKVKEVVKKERQDALAKVFGFSSGLATSNRKRNLSRLHRSPSYRRNASDSSEWTSESDSEYVSPPRGRRNRYGRKYLRPRSARVLQLEEEGGLFVLHGRRAYPLVNDGSVVKNYLAFSPQSDAEDEPAYWKKKYKEEKKKTEELKKMIEAKDKPIRDLSPVLPSTSKQSILLEPVPELIPIPEEPKVSVPPEKPKNEAKPHEKTLKIKFTKNNEELQVEGLWSQIHPVLADVVQLFNKDPEPSKEVQPSNTHGKSDADEILSLRSTPMDEDAIRKKVDKMEEEIFKEIEELEKSEREQEVTTRDTTKDEDLNVTKRKRLGRPRKSSTAQKTPDSSSSPVRPKLTKADKETTAGQQEAEKGQTEVENGQTEIENGQTEVENGQTEIEKENDEETVPKELPKRRLRTPKKYNTENLAVSKKSKKSPKNTRKTIITEPESPEDDDARYMLPPTKKTRKSYTKTTTNARSSNIPTNPTSENLSQNSIESSQGYQDSDPSPAKEWTMLKRKRKLSLSVLNRGKKRRYVRRRSYPCVSDDASSESSNLSFKIPIKNTSESESLKSEVYRSESYQLLMPAKKRSYTALEKIDELSTTDNLCMNDIPKIHVETFEMNSSDKPTDAGNVRSDGNSSNISFPLSPELSIVEKISISKELLENIDDFPTINEMQANDEPNFSIDNKYLLSAVDVTMPLMEQDCDIQKSTNVDPEYKFQQTTTESLLNKINSVNITEGPSISDSLGCRFRNLLLETAKKIEVDRMLECVTEENNNIAKNNTNKKSRAKKRCSTPHKRNSKKNSRVPDVDPVIEEERMEFCSYGGRKSCPPILPDIINTTENKPLKKGKKKKDVIKVKILKPSNKQTKVSPANVGKKSSHDVTTKSVHTDSGINVTGSALYLQDSDDSVDLIHNHSETCLQTKECLDDSVEFVDMDNSIISIQSEDAMVYLPPEAHCNNARDGTDVTRVNTMTSQSTSETVYLSPLASDLSANSLITEDLSDEIEVANPRHTNKWYLFSEDETTHTNLVPGFGSNLQQIFPITCAVPDLSTITENSKDSRTPTLDADGDTRNDLESQSLS